MSNLARDDEIHSLRRILDENQANVARIVKCLEGVMETLEKHNRAYAMILDRLHALEVKQGSKYPL